MAAGRQGPHRRHRPRARARRSGPIAPDEDPDFLRKLDEDIRRERREKERLRKEQEAREDQQRSESPEDPPSA